MIIQKAASFFRLISESIDKETSLKNDNKFFCVIISISMLIGSIASFLTCYYMLNEDIKTVTFGSSILLLFAILFTAFSLIKNEIMKMYIYSVLISAIIVFSFIEFYHDIGPAVWTISFLLMIIIMIYSRIEMLAIFLTTNIILNIYNWNKLTEFNNWKAYHPANCMILIALAIATIGVFKAFRNRQEKIISQYKDINLSEEKLRETLLSVIIMNKK